MSILRIKQMKRRALQAVDSVKASLQAKALTLTPAILQVFRDAAEISYKTGAEDERAGCYDVEQHIKDVDEFINKRLKIEFDKMAEALKK